MSLRTSTFRALSRSRTPNSKILVPFLYQTATIQQRHPAARRDASSRSRRGDDIPFENETITSSANDVNTSHNTTITGSERAAFEKLYKKFSAEEKPRDSNSVREEVDQVADEYYEEEDDDKDSESVSLDSVFDAVFTGQQTFKPRSLRPARGKAENLATLAEEILKPEIKAARAESQRLSKKRMEKSQLKETTRIQGLFEQAETDRELWQVVERQVFEQVRRMDLDGLATWDKKSKIPVAKRKRAVPGATQRFPTSPTDPPWDLARAREQQRLVFGTFPLHLKAAANVLRENFPASPLPFSILSTLKSLGRSSYALGATRGLYKSLIHTAWTQHASYEYIDELLHDMDNGGIECDQGLLELLDRIISQHHRATKNGLGTSMRMVVSLEQNQEGVRKLEAWRETIAQRLGTWTENRISNRGGIVSRTPFNRPWTPRDNVLGVVNTESNGSLLSLSSSNQRRKGFRRTTTS
ncbi:hypothetical protein BS50DRAFT_575677 [Corynespora cassiicola Philippines]|uniref:Mtf2-like C-terminal domain-containing protein n=1 Tax=Corynespora cassiicola Philippines TaxID=1448308 RepID=A0A2T2NFM4_CORCC|nr:hypothetical protein BS50DRAFT_575677 [Corynespora cassiicola Philippines]